MGDLCDRPSLLSLKDVCNRTSFWFRELVRLQHVLTGVHKDLPCVNSRGGCCWGLKNTPHRAVYFFVSLGGKQGEPGFREAAGRAAGRRLACAFG